MNFLTEHGIGSYEELTERCEAAAAAVSRCKAELRETEGKLSDLSLVAKHTETYRRMKPTYDRYRAARDKEKFLRGYETEIILFEASARALKDMDITKLPARERVRADREELTTRKEVLQKELHRAQGEEKQYETLRQNVDMLLSQPRETDIKRRQELE